MMPILYAILVIILSVNVLLGLPLAVDLIETKLISANIPTNKVIGADDIQNIAGVWKMRSIPKDSGILPPQLTAVAVLVEDLASDSILFAKNSHTRLPIASTTKIMTALVSVGYFKPNAVLTVPENISQIIGSTMGLKENEKLTFRSLLYGMLLNSGNDAAYTIAYNFPGGVGEFVAQMNKKALSLGLSNTHFDNPAGFDSPNHYSSASDLAKIALLVEDDAQLARVVSTKDTVVFSIDKTNTHPLKNLNKLLAEPGVLGIKTGTTPAAKENLVGLFERNGHKILTIVLGSDDRFSETDKLIDWVYQNFTWE